MALLRNRAVQLQRKKTWQGIGQIENIHVKFSMLIYLDILETSLYNKIVWKFWSFSDFSQKYLISTGIPKDGIQYRNFFGHNESYQEKHILGIPFKYDFKCYFKIFQRCAGMPQNYKL